MLFISKGIPEKNGISVELRIVIGGQICSVFGLEEELWLRGRLGFAETASRDEEAAIQNLIRTREAERAGEGRKDSPELDPRRRIPSESGGTGVFVRKPRSADRASAGGGQPSSPDGTPLSGRRDRSEHP